MRKGLVALIVVVLAGVAYWGLKSNTNAQKAASAPDLSGVWSLKAGPAYPGTRGSVTTFNLKVDSLLKPWAQERCEKIGCAQGLNPGGRPLTGEEFDESDDPVITTKCAPNGLTRSFFAGPFEIVQVPNSKKILMYWQTRDSIRRIWMDGRKHMDDPQLWMGDSVGHWEGDTLVVDTIGINDHGYFDDAGHPHSDDLHVVERMRLTDPKTMQIDFQFDDPKTFTEPFKGRLIFGLHPDIDMTENITCEDRIMSARPEDAWPYFVGKVPSTFKPPFPRPPAPAGSGRK